MVRLCRTEKPSRQAFCASAQANQLLPMPVGPMQQNVLMLADPFAAGQRAHQLAIESARMLVIDIFDHAALFQVGRIAGGAPERDSLSRATADRPAGQSVLRS